MVSQEGEERLADDGRGMRAKGCARRDARLGSAATMSTRKENPAFFRSAAQGPMLERNAARDTRCNARRYLDINGLCMARLRDAEGLASELLAVEHGMARRGKESQL